MVALIPCRWLGRWRWRRLRRRVRAEQREAFVARYPYLAPMAGNRRRCRLDQWNPRRPWMAFAGGPTIQRRWRDVSEEARR